MQASPEQALRAWIEYLRDMGVYELYRQDSPSFMLPREARELLQATHSARNITKDEQSDRGLRPAQPAELRKIAGSARVSTPVAAVARSEAGSATPRPAFQPPSLISPEPAKTYFSTEAEAAPALPPELAAPMPKPQPLESLLPQPATSVVPIERSAALDRLKAEIGDCTRCPLAYAGRHTIVFGEGDPNAKLMFIGEGPGADEDESGRPFVGKAGQLLNNMISAMGLAREAVYIANIVKCRPPGNRTPEFVEATTCSQFLLQQIDIVRPEIIVALGATAATYALGVRQSLASLRGQWFPVRGAKLAVTYHPAFLLRDPRQKAEAWKDLQRVMAVLELKPAALHKADG